MTDIRCGQFRKKILFRIGITGLLACFFGVYSFLAFHEMFASPVKLDSPDETANYYFAKTFAERFEIGYAEPLLKDSKNFIHPRSMTASADGTRVVPVSFLGMVLLYGILGKIFGSGAILFFTPAIAVLGALCFYFLLVQFFSKRLALISAALLLIHPAYWYYASRSMFPNVLFLDMLILSFLLLWKAFHATEARARRAYGGFFFSGLCIGLALIVRLSEIPWVFFLFLCIWVWNIRRFRIGGTVFFTSGIVVALAVLFGYNQQIYGNALSSGYAQIDTRQSFQGIQNVFATLWQWRMLDGAWWLQIAGSLQEICAPFLTYVFPFGFVPHLFKENFFVYGISLFWWFTLPAAIGVFCFFFDGLARISKHSFPKEWGYLAVFFLVGAWLIPFYGSWIISDTITGESTIGNSYIRYWLVLFCCMVPLAARGLLHLYDHTRFFIGRYVAMPMICFVVVWYSFQTVLWGGTDGLVSVADHMNEYRDAAVRVTHATEEDAIVFSSRSDKIFFPQRRVAQSFEGFPEAELIPSFVKRVPVYYYGLWNEAVAEYISKKYFLPYGLHWKYLGMIREKEYLYRVID